MRFNEFLRGVFLRDEKFLGRRDCETEEGRLSRYTVLITMLDAKMELYSPKALPFIPSFRFTDHFSSLCHSSVAFLWATVLQVCVN